MGSVQQLHDETDYPEFWDWSKDGAAEGTFVRMESGPTAFGTKPIMILDVSGVERSIWINTQSLRSKLADELERRKARDFTPGEHVAIRRGAEKKTSAADRQYWPFRVDFRDAPRSDAADPARSGRRRRRRRGAAATGREGRRRRSVLMAIYHEGRSVTTDALYAMEVSPETLLKYLRPRPEPERGTALRLFEPDVGRKPTAAELYAQSRHG